MNLSHALCKKYLWYISENVSSAPQYLIDKLASFSLIVQFTILPSKLCHASRHRPMYGASKLLAMKSLAQDLPSSEQHNWATGDCGKAVYIPSIWLPW